METLDINNYNNYNNYNNNNDNKLTQHKTFFPSFLDSFAFIKMIHKGAIAVAILAALASASPTPRSPVLKRWTDGKDCTSSSVGDQKTGLLFAVDSDGVTASCDDLADASEEKGYKCYVTNDKDELGDYAKCPGDPAPKKNPDGSDTDIGEAIIDTYCKTAGGPEWVNIPGCMIFGYYEARGDPVKEAESGAKGVCDTIFSGACTWFTEISPSISGSMDVPCTDDPGSNACDFANPG